MKIYLAGPMRGILDFNFPAFDYAAAKLRAQGHTVFSPAEKDRELLGANHFKNPTGDADQLAAATNYTIRDALGIDLAWICKEAEAIALLPGWENSTSANAERSTGIAIGATLIILGKEYVDVKFTH